MGKWDICFCIARQTRISNLEVDMRKILVVFLIAVGALTGCVGYAGDGYGRYSDRYDSYGGGSSYYGSGYRSGYRNVDYRRGDRRDWERRQEARRDAARHRDRNDWRDRRDHDRSNWNNRRDNDRPSRSSYRQTQRGMEGASRRLEQMRHNQGR